MQIKRHKRFTKAFIELHSKVADKVIETITIFSENPFDIRLRNHALQWKRYQGFRSLDVTGDYRIIFKELSDGTYELIELVDVWTHSQLYK